MRGASEVTEVYILMTVVSGQNSQMHIVISHLKLHVYYERIFGFATDVEQKRKVCCYIIATI